MVKKLYADTVYNEILVQISEHVLSQNGHAGSHCFTLCATLQYSYDCARRCHTCVKLCACMLVCEAVSVVPCMYKYSAAYAITCASSLPEFCVVM